MKTLVIYYNPDDFRRLCERTGKKERDFQRIDAMGKGEGFRNVQVICLPHYNLSFRHAGEFIETKRSLERRECQFVYVDSKHLADNGFDLARWLDLMRQK